MRAGSQIIGFGHSDKGSESFFSFNPATGQPNPFQFLKATPDEVNLAAEKAAAAFQRYSKKTG
ncbi:MAG: hypothetical protein B7Z54_06335, partial [Sphingobacteriales bacterium 12-47-4]